LEDEVQSAAATESDQNCGFDFQVPVIQHVSTTNTVNTNEHYSRSAWIAKSTKSTAYTHGLNIEIHVKIEVKIHFSYKMYAQYKNPPQKYRNPSWNENQNPLPIRPHTQIHG